MIAIAIGVLAALNAPLTGSAQARSSKSLTLTLSSSKPAYHVAEPVTLTLSIKNVSASSLTVSASDVGNIRLKLSFNGKQVKPTREIRSSYESVHAAQFDAVSPLHPGDVVTFPITTLARTNGTSCFLVERAPSNASDVPSVMDVFMYAYGQPGTYKIEATYKYGASSRLRPREAVAERVTSNLLTFSILP
jgi:hypothetical protein